MSKEFLPFDVVRNDALKLAHKIYKEDNFVPDVIYCSLRGGAYMANVISEYYKVALNGKKDVLYAAVVGHSYSGVGERSSEVVIDGWTYAPSKLKKTDKILLVDDIYDSGNTIHSLVEFLVSCGVARENLKVVVHDYKVFKYKEQPLTKPDYWCRKFVIEKPEQNVWIHYMSHELIGLTDEELEKNYYAQDPELRNVLSILDEK